MAARRTLYETTTNYGQPRYQSRLNTVLRESKRTSIHTHITRIYKCVGERPETENRKKIDRTHSKAYRNGLLSRSMVATRGLFTPCPPSPARTTMYSGSTEVSELTCTALVQPMYSHDHWYGSTKLQQSVEQMALITAMLRQNGSCVRPAKATNCQRCLACS